MHADCFYKCNDHYRIRAEKWPSFGLTNRTGSAGPEVTQKQQEEFQKLFTYSIPSDDFDPLSKYRPSAFNRYADAVIEGFTRKWHSADAIAKDTYNVVFLPKNGRDYLPESNLSTR
jgi:hypothetical protein